jgi:putative endonuclease
MAAHNDLGKWGEEVAAAYLQGKDYAIVARDWKQGHRDLDIIAVDPAADTLVFVEVKARRNRLFTDPVDAVGYEKIRNLRLLANYYVKLHHVDLDIRFDIISVVGMPGSEPEIEHIIDAF